MRQTYGHKRIHARAPEAGLGGRGRHVLRLGLCELGDPQMANPHLNPNTQREIQTSVRIEPSSALYGWVQLERKN